MRPSSEKLLVISEIGIGDALTLLPVLRSLKQSHPLIEIEMIAPGLYDLKENLTDWLRILDHKQIPPGRHEKKIWLEKKAFTYIWNTENEQSEWRRVLIASGNPHWISAQAHRYWPRRFVLNLRLNQLQRLFPDINQNHTALLPLTQYHEQNRKKILSQKKDREIWIALQPGAKDKTKCWPIYKYQQLITMLSKNSQIKIKLFLTLSERDKINQNDLLNIPGLEIITDSLDHILPLLSTCNLFIGNDSGFYHLAYALGLPVIGIYRSRRNMIVWSYPSPRSRAVCFWLPSPIRRYWHHFISVKRIFNTAYSLLNEFITDE